MWLAANSPGWIRIWLGTFLQPKDTELQTAQADTLTDPRQTIFALINVSPCKHTLPFCFCVLDKDYESDHSSLLTLFTSIQRCCLLSSVCGALFWQDTVSADEEDDEVDADQHAGKGRSTVCHDTIIHHRVPVLTC